MNCPSCRHPLTHGELRDPSCVRGGVTYCRACLGRLSPCGGCPEPELSIQEYWDLGLVPPGVTTWAARSDPASP